MELAEYARMDAAEDRMWWYGALHRRLVDALTKVQGTVLDVGCGTGGFLARLRADRGDLYGVGVDRAEAAIRRAVLKSGAPIVCASACQLPFADACFDGAVAADVLCHAAVDPARALSDLWRVLRPGGRLIVNMPAYRWLFSAHDRQVHNVRRFTAGGLSMLLREGGFVRIRAGYWNGLLLPAMVAQRKLLARHAVASDVAPFPPWLDAMFHGITEIERRLPCRLPAGGSVLAIAERP
jgi:SAM-dependent methyltransferase